MISADEPTGTGLVVMGKLFVLLPGAMPIVAGTCTTPGLLLERFTTPPPEGAGVTRATVPLSELPPMTPLPFAPIADNVGGPGGPGSISSIFAAIRRRFHTAPGSSPNAAR